ERERNDGCGDPLLESVELSDFDFRAGLGVPDVHAAQRDVFLQDRRARSARDDADLLAPDVHALAVRRRLVAFELQPDEHALRVRTPLLERRLADELVLLVLGDGKADAR